jgi:hypothetical protein
MGELTDTSFNAAIAKCFTVDKIECMKKANALEDKAEAEAKCHTQFSMEGCQVRSGLSAMYPMGLDSAITEGFALRDNPLHGIKRSSESKKK